MKVQKEGEKKETQEVEDTSEEDNSFIDDDEY
jgi:hypothetical protein